MAPASRNISTHTSCQQIGNFFSAWLQLYGISAHSLPVNRLAISSVSMAAASRNISTLTLCKQIGNVFGQHGSSCTEYEHTHFLSTEWQLLGSALLHLHGISAHSLSVNRLAISSVNMPPAS